jgi:hypothetical protein
MTVDSHHHEPPWTRESIGAEVRRAWRAGQPFASAAAAQGVRRLPRPPASGLVVQNNTLDRRDGRVRWVLRALELGRARRLADPFCICCGRLPEPPRGARPRLRTSGWDMDSRRER